MEPLSETPASWADTPRGRRELLTVAVVAGLLFVMPFVRTDLYPFSALPMFQDAPQCYCEYTITAPDGRSLSPSAFGLQRNYWGNPLGAGVGFLPPPSVDQFGCVADADAVRARVQRQLQTDHEFDHVEVTQTVIGPRADGSVGVVATSSWRVSRSEAP